MPSDDSAAVGNEEFSSSGSYGATSDSNIDNNSSESSHDENTKTKPKRDKNMNEGKLYKFIYVVCIFF